MSLLHDVSVIQDLFLRASLDPLQWTRALRALAEATGSMRAQLIGVGARGALAFNFITEIDESFNDDFLRVPGHHDPATNYRVAATRPPGEIVFEDHYDRARARIGATAYEEACERHGLPFGCQTSLSQDSGALVGLALLRSRREGPTTPEHRAIFAALVPTARAAARLQLRTESRGIRLVRGALDAVNAHALLVDGFGRVTGMTSAAEQLLAATTRLDVRGGALAASTPGQTSEIHAALANVLYGRRPEATVLLRGGGEPPLALTVQALPAEGHDMGFRPRAVILLKGGPAESAEPESLRGALQIEFGLTGSEAEIAAQLAACTPRAQIAELRGTTLGTVRQQIKAIFAKLGVSREAEFMALLASFTRA